MNMFSEFYKWMTYNPDNISMMEYLPNLIVFFCGCALVLYAVTVVATDRIFRLKNIICTIVFTPYFMVSILWTLCFMDGPFIKSIAPVFPLAIMVMIRRTYGYLKKPVRNDL